MTDSADGDLTVVLVHGGFLGPWIWADVVRELSRDGLRSVCVDLPSCRGTGTKLAGRLTGVLRELAGGSPSSESVTILPGRRF